MNQKKTVLFFLIPVLLSFILHFHVLDLEIVGYHVWRQAQTQTVIYNFSFADNSILNPQRFDLSSGSPSILYEFPLYQWLIAHVNNLFSYSVSNTRVFTFIFFVCMLTGFYRLLRKFVNQNVALLANGCICFSPLLYYYCVNPLPDILALCFGVWCLNYFSEFIVNKKIKGFVLFCLFFALASLTKLPYVLFGSGFILFVYRHYKTGRRATVMAWSVGWLLALVPSFLWYVKAIPTWKTNKVGLGISANTKTPLELFDYFQSNLISSMPELVTNYGACIFLFVGFYFFFKNKKWKNEMHSYFLFLFFFCAAYFFYELNMIERTHDYYLLPFVPFIFLVVASGINVLLEQKRILLVAVCVAAVPVLAFFRIDHRWNLAEPGFNKNFLLHHEAIKNHIPDNELCVIDADESKYIALYYLKRQGYSLYPNEINPDILENLYKRGGHYLLTENKKFDTTSYKNLYFERLFDQELKLYKLSAK